MATEATYAATSDEAWDLEPCTARLEPRDDPWELVLEGACPRCGHHSVHREPLHLVQGFRDLAPAEREPLVRAAALALREAGLLPQGRQERDVVLLCACGVDHPRTPDGARGCGAAWRKHVAWTV